MPQPSEVLDNQHRYSGPRAGIQNPWHTARFIPLQHEHGQRIANPTQNLGPGPYPNRFAAEFPTPKPVIPAPEPESRIPGTERDSFLSNMNMDNASPTPRTHLGQGLTRTGSPWEFSPFVLRLSKYERGERAEW